MIRIIAVLFSTLLCQAAQATQVTNVFNEGDVASATQINQNFDDLESAIDHVLPQRVVWVADDGSGDYPSLSQALANISPSAEAPYLIKVAPGTFTETTTVTLPAYVDIEGSGTGVTRIICDRCQPVNAGEYGAVIRAVSNVNSQIRQITLEYTGSSASNQACGIYVNGFQQATFSVLNVDILVDGPMNTAGLVANSAQIHARNLSVTVIDGGTFSRGLHAIGPSRIELDSVRLSVTGASNDYGIDLEPESELSGTNLFIESVGYGARAGVQADQATLNVTNSAFSLISTNTNGFVNGILAENNSAITVSSSRVTVEGTGGAPTSLVGLRCRKSECDMQGSQVSVIGADYATGVYVDQDASMTIDSNIVNSKAESQDSVGVFARGADTTSNAVYGKSTVLISNSRIAAQSLVTRSNAAVREYRTNTSDESADVLITNTLVEGTVSPLFNSNVSCAFVSNLARKELDKNCIPL